MGCALAQVGGNWTNGSNAGLSYWNLNNSASNANSNVGRQTLISSTSSFHAPYVPDRLVEMQP